MGHVIALDVELHCPVHGFFKDAQKLWCDFFLARHGRFDGCLRKCSGSSFELMQDFGCFHWHFRAATIFFSIFLRPRWALYAKISSIDGDETHLGIQSPAPFLRVRMERIASRLTTLEGGRHGDQESRQNGFRYRR
jgi:hypothetical protein